MSKDTVSRPSISRLERADGRRFFVYAPPRKGIRRSKRKPPKPPFVGAKPWQCSVYYFWWKYLRENDDYIKCCNSSGRGPLAKLYRDFGDVRDDDFWAWWRSHEHLFCEPPLRRTHIFGSNEGQKLADYVLLAVPGDMPVALAVQQIRKLLPTALKRPKRLTTDSQASYPVATKPILSSLHMHLRVWEARKKHPEKKLHELADLVGLIVSENIPKELAAEFRRDPTLYRKDIDREIRHKKAVLASRHLRIAAQYIKNVGKGQFPKRERR